MALGTGEPNPNLLFNYALALLQTDRKTEVQDAMNSKSCSLTAFIHRQSPLFNAFLPQILNTSVPTPRLDWCFCRLVSNYPSRVSGAFNSSHLTQTEQYNESIAALQKAHQLRPNELEVLYNLGKTQQHLLKKIILADDENMKSAQVLLSCR